MGNSENRNSRFEIRSPSGQLLCTVAVFGALVATKLNGENQRASESRDRTGGRSGKEEPKPAYSSTPSGRKETHERMQGRRNHTQHMSENGFMTDAQRRFLFRLLADQGIEGEKAHEHLKRFFQVKSLREVPKVEASQGIEKLLHEARGVGP